MQPMSFSGRILKNERDMMTGNFNVKDLLPHQSLRSNRGKILTWIGEMVI